MRGVIRSVDRELVVDDLTHEIPAYNVWEAAYRLNAVVDYWPQDTVFVSVVDPGVGTSRKSVVARLKNGLTIVTPDNGTLTLVAQRIGIDAVREIDEHKHRLPGSEGSYTFHGRDVYAYDAALLASGKMKFDDVGPLLQSDIVEIEYEKPGQSDARIFGGIPVLDPQYGNIWTNIPAALLDGLKVRAGDRLQLTITEGVCRAWHSHCRLLIHVRRRGGGASALVRQQRGHARCCASTRRTSLRPTTWRPDLRGASNSLGFSRITLTTCGRSQRASRATGSSDRSPTLRAGSNRTDYADRPTVRAHWSFVPGPSDRHRAPSATKRRR